MTGARTAAVLGATGGAGATRLAVELAATLARAGRSVAVVDAAFATQGLARYVDGTIDPDVTTVLADDASLDDALYRPGWDVPGSALLAPSYAPFERLARASGPDAARELEAVVATLSERVDHVLLDVPPLATNPAVAAVTAADRVVVTIPDGERGVDALQRTRGRLADVGAKSDLVVANRTTARVPDADVVVPTADSASVPDAPAALDGRTPFAPAVARVAADALSVDLDLSFDGGLVDAARRQLRR